MKLAIPDLISNSYFPALAAAELGCFAAEGLDVTAELIFPVDRCYQALRDGEVDFVAGAAHGALAGFHEWRGVKLLGALAQGMYWFLVMHADLEIARGDLQALKGRRIGAAPWVEMGIRRLLAAAGVDIRRDGVSIGPVPGATGGNINFGLTAAQALENREIDGFWANGMATEIAVGRGIGTVVLDVRRGDGPPGCFDYTFGALATTARLAENAPDTAAAALRALVAAQNALKADVSRATEVGLKRFPPREAGLIAGIVARDLPYYDPAISPAQFAAVNAFAEAMSLVDGEAPYADVVATGFSDLWRGSCAMRTGADYREALRDGRRVWVMGEGRVDDVTTHPATRAMIDEYVAWYDRHADPAWRDIVMAPADAAGHRRPVSFVFPRSADDLVRMGKCFSATTFLSAGNITHTPAYGHLISLGMLVATHEHGHSPEMVARARAYRDRIADSGRFLTFCGGAAPLGIRLREDPSRRAALRVVRETDAGVILSGRVGMHTSPAYAEDVYVGALNGVQIDGHPASFIVPVGGKGVTILCRRLAVRDPNRFNAPLSSRFDELDGQMWLDDVFIPWEHVFLVDASPEPIARWLLWHHLYGWLSKAEFTLGIAFALTDAMALKEHEPTIEYLVDLIAEVQTVRACLTAAERDPQFTPEGYCFANYTHLMPGGIAILRAHQRMSEILRALPGSSLVVAPSDRDLAEPELAAGLDECFGGGGYTALQRSALLQLAWDHVASALDGRESSFELHASGGMPMWRGRLRKGFDRYNELANGVLKALDIQMPAIDLGAIRDRPLAPRRINTPVPPKS